MNITNPRNSIDKGDGKMKVKRLTRNGRPTLSLCKQYYSDEEECFEKLSKLEDIEEELGVALVKLLSANTIFVDEGGGVLVANDFKISFADRCVYVSVYDCDDTELPFSDYGKTWALTKEEMEE